MVVGDVLLVLSLLCLALAVIYPRIQRGAYEDRVNAAVSDVEAVKASAHRHLEREGTWPAESPSGRIPAELVGTLPTDFTPVSAHYTMDWNLWETVRIHPPPDDAQPDGNPDPEGAAPVEIEVEGPDQRGSMLQPLAGITIHSDEEGLLAALLQRYGQELSFVREGSWTLILEDAG